MKKKLIAGNWKMNGSLTANAALIDALVAGYASSACLAAVCVPSPYLAQVHALLGASVIGDIKVGIHLDHCEFPSPCFK